MRDFSVKEIEAAIKDSGGIMSTIAERLRCDWHTADKYIKADKSLIEAYTAETESVIDLAESKLIENIGDNDNTAIIFYLKTKGKKRGYVERSEVETTVTKIELTPEERAAKIAALKAKL